MYINITYKQLFVKGKRYINIDDLFYKIIIFFIKDEDSQFRVIQRKILCFPIFLQFHKISEEHDAQKYFNVSTYKEYMSVNICTGCGVRYLKSFSRST